MGKVATAEMKRKKKKGRPAKTQIPVSAPRNPIILGSPPITYSRSHRRNPKYFTIPTDFDGGDDDDERKEKKVKLVVRLPQSDENPVINQNQQQKKKAAAHSGDRDSASPSESGFESEQEPGNGSGSEPESAEDRDARAKKRKINAVDRGSDGPVSTQEKKDVKVTVTQQNGLPLEAGPTIPLPDKKLLVFILDRLQKKDTYGVFSEPVDVNELPDYFEVIEKPMDFGTVRKKLNRGAYKKLEELEADVFLICSNALLYNAPDTVYYRQARSIQDIAKRDFENLRHEGDNGEPQPKVVRRGRPPSSKNQKKSLETSPLDRIGADLSSGATLTNTEDKAAGSNTYNLRKGPALYRYRDPYLSSSYKPRNGENYSELMGDWNNEFPASILRADMKYGKKQFIVDENRRDTYRQFHPLSPPSNSSSFANSMGDMKRLVTVGLHEPFAYARSLARFAANLGPGAWKVASMKIESVLPPGTEYGPGWVSEARASSSSSKPSFLNNPNLDSRTPDLSSSLPHGLSEEMIEAVRRLNSQNERSLQGDESPWKTPFPQIQQNHMYQSQIQPQIQPQIQNLSQIQPQIQNLNQMQTQIPRNGFSGMLGYSAMEGFQFPTQAINNPMLSSYSSAIQEEAKLQEMLLRQQAEMSTALPRQQGEMWAFGRSPWPAVPAQHGRSIAGTPDLNLRVPAGSPSSSLQIGSPQPDLALQL